MRRIADSVVVPHPEPYVRRSGFGSRRIADLLEGKAVFLAGYRKPGHYASAMAAKGYSLGQREATMPGKDGEPVKGITVWVKELVP